MNDDELERMKSEYRSLRVDAILGNAAASSKSEQLAQTMRDFCVANGRDVQALAEFFGKADTDVFNGYSPG